MIALKKYVRQTVTVQLILLVDSHGLIVELHISSCLATFTAGRILYEQNGISFVCIVGYILRICISDASIHSAFSYMHGYIAQHNGVDPIRVMVCVCALLQYNLNLYYAVDEIIRPTILHMHYDYCFQTRKLSLIVTITVSKLTY